MPLSQYEAFVAFAFCCSPRFQCALSSGSLFSWSTMRSVGGGNCQAMTSWEASLLEGDTWRV